MLQPGGKNWIEKYFSLVEKELIDIDINPPKDLSLEEFLHAELFQTGLAFGYPSQMLFSNQVDQSSWTLDEKVKVLLFESLLHVYELQHEKIYKDEFIETLVDFYADYKESYSFNVFSFFVKESSSVKLEAILSRRVHVKKTWINIFWVNYLSNSLVFLDVLAYRQFLISGNQLKENYEVYVNAILKTIILASYSDGSVDPEEKTIFDVFIASANLPTEKHQYFKKLSIEGSLKLSDIELPEDLDTLFSFYLVDLAVLTVFSDLTAMDDEMVFLYELCNYLNVDTDYLHHSLVLIEGFVLENNHKVSFLSESSSYERLYQSFTNRWIKVLGRNKDKLVDELKNNKELVTLVNKSLVEDLSTEEKEKVKTQFKDLVKSMPALAIFMLPGGALLLPLITRIVPALLPSSFKQNDLKKD